MVFLGELFELLAAPAVVVGDEVEAWAEGGEGVCDGKQDADGVTSDDGGTTDG